ncbi:MAG: hypothetical protein ISR65_18085 [Bacteriovoracaceae bacterium]|nr:hypothetical protein [Bacteriovoracaceae bacterium]
MKKTLLVLSTTLLISSAQAGLGTDFIQVGKGILSIPVHIAEGLIDMSKWAGKKAKNATMFVYDGTKFFVAEMSEDLLVIGKYAEKSATALLTCSPNGVYNVVEGAWDVARNKEVDIQGFENRLCDWAAERFEEANAQTSASSECSPLGGFGACASSDDE